VCSLPNHDKAVFYNLDHFATLLPKSVRLVGFPDAGFFMDAKDETSGNYSYRGLFQGADPVWNLTGSGGTNLKCLTANVGAEWKCLMAQYIAPHVETPMFVLNSDYDAWQMEHVLGAGDDFSLLFLFVLLGNSDEKAVLPRGEERSVIVPSGVWPWHPKKVAKPDQF
jgi:hypothetical protein